LENVISFEPHFIKKRSQPFSLQELFRKYPVVLAGDELAAFYLDKWTTLTGEGSETEQDASKDPFYLWGKRDQHETIVSYMELVHSAFEAGVRDIVIDANPAMQPGINKALEAYNKKLEEQTEEDIFHSLLESAIATPMDAVIQMAGVLDMKVHALNGGLSGIATLFRETSGGVVAEPFDDVQEKVDAYMKDGFGKDVETLERVFRRPPTDIEKETMCEQMRRRLVDQSGSVEKEVFDEEPTIKLIHETLQNKPFLGFFQNSRLLRSSSDLDARLRFIYGEEKVGRLSMVALEDYAFPKYPQYHFSYSMKECTVAMTEACAQDQKINKPHPSKKERNCRVGGVTKFFDPR